MSKESTEAAVIMNVTVGYKDGAIGRKEMTMKFSVNRDDGYVVVTSTGLITDLELVDAYAEFYQSDEWFPALNELSDLSKADTTHITTSGFQNLAYLGDLMQKKHNVAAVKVAIFAPNLHHFGLARQYDGMTSDLPRLFQVFRKMQDAEDWIKI